MFVQKWVNILQKMKTRRPLDTGLLFCIPRYAGAPRRSRRSPIRLMKFDVKPSNFCFPSQLPNDPARLSRTGFRPMTSCLANRIELDRCKSLKV